MADSQPKDAERRKARLVLRDLDQGAAPPAMTVYAVDEAFKPLARAEVDERGEFELPDDAMKRAASIVVGPPVDDLDALERDQLAIYRPDHFAQLLKELNEISIPRRDWYGWLKIWRCVDGTVRHCHPFPWWINDLVAQVNVAEALAPQAMLASRAQVAESVSLRASAASRLQIFRPFHCEHVCEGMVEVYRRTCCCQPWIIYDPRLPELIRNLEELIRPIPPIPWPPIPEPDPPPLRALPFFKSGALDERVLAAPSDLAQIRSLAAADQAAYILARPYLWCSCGAPKKVAQGFVQPSGKFHICWSEWPYLLPKRCHVEYAFIVRQVINGQLVTIYNGVAAGKWFHAGEDADLVSYHPGAIDCPDLPPPPVKGAVALLDYVGVTDSVHLKTPAATGWDRVAAPGFNDGLACPAATVAAAAGKYLNRNWGGVLPLRFYFSEQMKAAGAVYYRVSVVEADASGAPTGARTYLSDSLSWEKIVPVSGGYDIVPVVLGPNPVGAEKNLFRIPYNADAAPGGWRGIQYHAYLDTTDFDDQRHLVTLEIFNAAGQAIRPAGTPGPGVDAAFTFGRARLTGLPAPDDKTVDNVPFAALTHMFWWDNRPAHAQIVDLRANGAPSMEECQFLEGPGGTLFSVGYRAYHPVEQFQLYHDVWWRRGLGGASGSLVNDLPNNVGQPPAGPGASGSASFAALLGTHDKCSFSVNLHVYVKTFNGTGTLSGLNASDQAAFAVEQTGP